MTTRIFNTTDKSINECAKILLSGGLVAFPTETVYGLGANALDSRAVAKIFIAKGRPSDNPLIVHIADKKQLGELVVDIPVVAQKLVDTFMPGALTIVLPKKAIVPDIVTAGHSTVAVRIPSNSVAQRLLAECGVPVCAPSANLSTRPSPTTAAHVTEDLNGCIDAVIDGGQCVIGVESTVVDFAEGVPRILRSGGVSREDIASIAGEVREAVNLDVALAPGMKYKHYAPSVDMYYAEYTDNTTERIKKHYDSLTQRAKPVIICLEGNAKLYGNRNVIVLGKTKADYATNIFATLRTAEKQYTAIIAEGIEEAGIGQAIINRLIKSSGGKTV
ncbi:MAG: L-threonylcarbamoyladenylate synthase [Firmicutes bacterium]|nr:L-threonylcarbamoyladenylate synthase [Bacillota bacterium]